MKQTNHTSARQTTLAGSVEARGIGLHTAVPVQVKLMPAPPDTGYVFRRTDLGGFEIPATVESVAHCSYATTLMRTGVMLSTVEHLLSALRGCGVDNAYIEVDNLEVPIMDGSAEAFAEMIESAGLVDQPTARRALLVREKVSAVSGNRRISIEPADAFEIDCVIDFPHPLIGVQHRSVTLDNGSFAREIASARTFGFIEEVEALRRANLIRGDLEDAGLLDPGVAVHFADTAPGAGVDSRIRRAGTDIDSRHNRPSALFSSDLEPLLEELGADALVLTGVSVNNAISSTARDAFARDLPAFVVNDLVGATPWEPEELHESYFATLATWTAEVADSADVLARLQQR